MRWQLTKRAIVLLGLVAMVATAAVGVAAEPDWKAVEQALGKPGQG